MSVTRDEMLRRMQNAASQMDFNARGTPKTRAQLEQMNAGPRAMLDFWQKQYAGQNNYGQARQMQTDRLRSAEQQVGMQQSGMTRRSRLGAGFGEYGEYRKPTELEQSYTSGMGRMPFSNSAYNFDDTQNF